MPAQQIASNLAYINWTVLSGLAVGAYAIALLARWRTSATPGFVRFTVICALLFGVLAWFSDGALPATLGDSPVVANPAFDAPRRAALAAFVLVGAADLFLLRNRPISRYAGIVALAAGLLVLVFGALAWGSGSTVGLLLQLAFLAASIGGVFAAMILGHWYLVTPKLPEAPSSWYRACCWVSSRSRSGCSRSGLRPAPGRPTWPRSPPSADRGRSSSGCA